jgi:hypothetical protein
LQIKRCFIYSFVCHFKPKSSEEVVVEYWKEYERNGCGLFEVLSGYFSGGTLEIHEYPQYG